MKKLLFFLGLVFFIGIASYASQQVEPLDSGDEIAFVIDEAVDFSYQPIIDVAMEVQPKWSVPTEATMILAIDPILLDVLNRPAQLITNERWQLDRQTLDPPEFIYYCAGLKLPENWDWQILLIIFIPVLGMFGIAWKSVSITSGKIGKGIESAAQFGNQFANTLDEWGLDKASLVVKEGSEVLDELGDVPAVLAKLTADGNFNISDAKAVLNEGKEVVVVFKDMLLKVKKKEVPAVG